MIKLTNVIPASFVELHLFEYHQCMLEYLQQLDEASSGLVI